MPPRRDTDAGAGSGRHDAPRARCRSSSSSSPSAGAGSVPSPGEASAENVGTISGVRASEIAFHKDTTTARQPAATKHRRVRSIEVASITKCTRSRRYPPHEPSPTPNPATRLRLGPRRPAAVATPLAIRRFRKHARPGECPPERGKPFPANAPGLNDGASSTRRGRRRRGRATRRADRRAVRPSSSAGRACHGWRDR